MVLKPEGNLEGTRLTFFLGIICMSEKFTAYGFQELKVELQRLNQRLQIRENLDDHSLHVCWEQTLTAAPPLPGEGL